MLFGLTDGETNPVGLDSPKERLTVKRILRKSAFVAVVLTLTFPTAALAVTSEHGGKPPAGTLFVLRGTLQAYSPAPSALTFGGVTITVSRSNHANKTLSGRTLSFPTSTNTRVVLHKGTFTAGDNGIVDVRAATLADLTDGVAPASEVVDQGAPIVLFVIRGTVSSYTGTPGTISETIKSSNHESSLLKAASPVMFTTGSKTKVVLHDGKPIANGDKVIVKIRAARNASVATLAADKAFQVIDQG